MSRRVVQPEQHEAAKRAVGIPHAGAVTPESTTVEIYGGVVEDCCDDPVDGLLSGVERGLNMLITAMRAPAIYSLEHTDYEQHLYDMVRRVDAARELYWRIVYQSAEHTPGNGTEKDARIAGGADGKAPH